MGFACSRKTSGPTIQKGFIDLTDYSFVKKGPISLKGQWIIFWNWMPAPEEVLHRLQRINGKEIRRESPLDYMKLPGRWNGHELTDGSAASGIGYATFALRYHGLAADDMHRLAFRMKDALTAYRIFIADDSAGLISEPVMTNGVVGTSEATSVPQHLPLVAPLPANLSNGWIIFQVSNFHDGVGGPIYPLILGTESQLLLQREDKRSRDFLVLGVLLVMSLYHLGLYFQRKEDRSSLWFSVFNAILALRMLLTEKYIQSWWPEPNETAFEWMMKFDYATVFLAVPVFFFFLQTVFPWKPSHKLRWPVWIIAGLFLLTLIFPQRVYGPIATFYFIWALIMSLWMLVGVFVVMKKEELGAGISFTGLLALMVGGIHDTLLAEGVIASMYLLPYAFIFFVIAQSYILVRRFSHAFHTAEHLSQNLAREVAVQTAQLEERNKQLEDITRQRTLFFQNISHELRTPLTLIYGLLESVDQGDYGPTGKNLQRPLASLQKNTRQLLRLINQLLDLSRIEAGQVKMNMQAVNISRILGELVESYQELAERKRIRLEVNLKPDVYVSGDGEKLEKVFYNLMSNAMKFTPEGGRVEIALAQDTREAKIRFKDSGPGIAETDQRRIFHRFFQADGARTGHQEGTGIGLAIVKEFIELHDGKLELESRSGEGATFVVVLKSLLDPNAENYRGKTTLYRADSEQTRGERAEPKGNRPGRPEILVVEDSEDMRAFIAHVLRNDYNVVLAKNGKEGVTLAREKKPDLILTDVMMPVMDGPAMIAELKSDPTLESIPCAILSARMELEDDDNSSNADFFLAKPFKPAELKNAVQEFLHAAKDAAESMDSANSRDSRGSN